MNKFILEKPNYLPKELCENLIKRFDSHPNKTKGSYTVWSFNKQVCKQKYNEQVNIHSWTDVRSVLEEYIIKAVEMYDFHLFKEFDYPNQEYHPLDQILKREYWTTEFFIHKIKKGDKYEWHTDTCPSKPSYIQMIFYLNTVENGGRTLFISNKNQGVKPEAGKLLIFPTSWTFPHSGEEVFDDAKYILTVGITLVPRE